jgi:hypothetical protein
VLPSFWDGRPGQTDLTPRRKGAARQAEIQGVNISGGRSSVSIERRKLPEIERCGWSYVQNFASPEAKFCNPKYRRTSVLPDGAKHFDRSKARRAGIFVETTT